LSQGGDCGDESFSVSPAANIELQVSVRSSSEGEYPGLGRPHTVIMLGLFRGCNSRSCRGLRAQASKWTDARRARDVYSECRVSSGDPSGNLPPLFPAFPPAAECSSEIKPAPAPLQPNPHRSWRSWFK